MDKLAEIMAWKRKEISNRLRPIRDQELTHLGSIKRPGPTFKDSLVRESGLAVISEIKRKSPSAGEIKSIESAPDQARKYLNAEVDAISVLTDMKYFGGELKDLWEVTDFLSDHQRYTPCLRKDFMVHPLQIIEAAEAGAKAILIIVRALSNEEIRIIYSSAKAAGLDALFEIHSESELEKALEHEPEIIGVNNRDLTVFKTDLGISEDLIPMIPDGIVTISESGIHTPDDAERAFECGANAALIGEALMKAENPDEIVKFCHSL